MKISEFNQTIHEWELRQGKTLLGTLERTGQGWPWALCRFQPTTEFEVYRPLFVEELRLFDRDDFDAGAWKSAYQRISELGLVLWPCGPARPVRDFLLHIRDDEGWFRVPVAA